MEIARAICQAREAITPDVGDMIKEINDDIGGGPHLTSVLWPGLRFTGLKLSQLARISTDKAPNVAHATTAMNRNYSIEVTEGIAN